MTPRFRIQLSFFVAIFVLFGSIFLATYLANSVYVPLVEQLGGSVDLQSDDIGNQLSIASWGYIGFHVVVFASALGAYLWSLSRILSVPVKCPKCDHEMKVIEKGAVVTYLCKECDHREHFVSKKR